MRGALVRIRTYRMYEKKKIFYHKGKRVLDRRSFSITLKSVGAENKTRSNDVFIVQCVLTSRTRVIFLCVYVVICNRAREITHIKNDNVCVINQLNRIEMFSP